MAVGASVLATGLSGAVASGGGKGAVALVASGLSAFGALAQGFATQRAADFDAFILRQRAERERLQAESDEEDFRRKQSRILAARRAALGGTGVEPSEGSPLLVSEDFAGEVELQALRIRSGGEVRATRAEQQAKLLRFAGRGAGQAGIARGGALLLSGAGKAFA